MENNKPITVTPMDRELEEPSESYWKTKEGKKIPLNKIHDSHLLNIVNLLITNCLEGQISFGLISGGFIGLKCNQEKLSEIVVEASRRGLDKEVEEIIASAKMMHKFKNPKNSGQKERL